MHVEGPSSLEPALGMIRSSAVSLAARPLLRPPLLLHQALVPASFPQRSKKKDSLTFGEVVDAVDLALEDSTVVV